MGQNTLSKPGIVLCSRVNSRRLPEKPLLRFAGKPAIVWLCERLLRSGVPVCLATPQDAADDPLHDVTRHLPLMRFRGHSENVLARFYAAAIECEFDPIVRVTHDDLLVDDARLQQQLAIWSEEIDYAYAVGGLRGADFEIVSEAVCRRAIASGKSYGEYLSWAFRAFSAPDRIRAFTVGDGIDGALELDYAEDALALQQVAEAGQFETSPTALYQWLRAHPSVFQINAKPTVTIYTAAYNAAATIERAMVSVGKQSCPGGFEYRLIDDGSTDATAQRMMEWTGAGTRLRTASNHGLASACNRVLREARGRYLLRLDADDELLDGALEYLVAQAQTHPEVAAWYPAYEQNGVVHQNTAHHLGGALLRAQVYHELKFYDGLRRAEGHEFYARLVQRYQAQQVGCPTWRYHRSAHSLSTTAVRPSDQVVLGDFPIGEMPGLARF